LRARPWVVEVDETTGDDGGATLRVVVSDEAAAEAELLRVVLEDPEVVVADFRRQVFELEEVFLRLVGANEATA
jgi:hypothetical protein